MRILWVKVGGLWPLNSGGRQRSFQMLSQLSRQHQVVVVTTAGPADEPDHLVEELRHCERVISVPYAAAKHNSRAFVRSLISSWTSPLPVDLWKWRVPAVRRAVAGLLASEAFDVVVADFLAGVPNVPSRSGRPVVLFEHNVEFLIWKRLRELEPRWWRRLLLDIEWRKMRRFEALACRRADVTVAVSDDDQERLEQLAPTATVRSVPTGVDVSYFAPSDTAEVANRLVFSGSMDWYPNEDAMLHFVDAILPRVRREIPGVSLTIVGRNPSAKIRALADVPGVQVTGTVPDVRPFIGEGAISIVPLRAGGGTRIKIFEAFAMGKPVLSTTVGAEGLALEPGRHVVLADGVEEFSRAVVALLRNAEQRKALGTAGRQLVHEKYSWESVTAVFADHLEEARRVPVEGREVAARRLREA